MLFGAREAGCFREVAALHSDHLRQVPLYYVFVVASIGLTLCLHTYHTLKAYRDPVILLTFISSSLSEETGLTSIVASFSFFLAGVGGDQDC